MATFKTCVRFRRSDGYYPVYIRVTHGRKSEYMKTNMLVFEKNIKKGLIKDPYVIVEGANRIKCYIDRLNLETTDKWSVSDVVGFLIADSQDISFTSFAKRYIDKLYNQGKEKNAKFYRNAVNSFHRYFDAENIMCHQITHNSIVGFIESLSHTARAKSSYTICIKTLFFRACDEYNDYDQGVMKIKNQPFRKITIPKNDTTQKKALDIDVIRKFFSCELPSTKMAFPLPELARDVCLLSFCLAGINSVDLYQMEKNCLREDWTLCYNRSKVASRRADKAYMEIVVPIFIRFLFNKYKGKDRLFNFCQRFSTSDSFNADVNVGIKTICDYAGIPPFSFYAFRHSWATIAQNDINAAIEDVAFALNHQSAHKVTMGYIKKDFTKADKLNEKVLKLVFG